MLLTISGGNTTDRFSELIRNLTLLDALPRGSAYSISDDHPFITPLSILPLAAVTKSRNIQYTTYFPDSSASGTMFGSLNRETNMTSYLKTIRFPDGLDLGCMAKNSATFLPIIHTVLSSRENSNNEVFNRLPGHYIDLMERNIIADPGFMKLVTRDTFGFLLSEMFDNVSEHAMAKNLYVFAQYWPRLNSCEICILDDGQGILGSLRQAGRNVHDSRDALEKILSEGLSAKDEFGDSKRATGIRNTRKALTNNELGGEFLIFSGNVAFLQSSDLGEKWFLLQNYAWKGTIIMLKINRPKSRFNLYEYVR